MVYQIEKMLRESGDKISGSERGEVENALADAKKALESNDKAQMDRAREALTQASHKLAEQMYKATQPGRALAQVQRQEQKQVRSRAAMVSQER